MLSKKTYQKTDLKSDKEKRLIEAKAVNESLSMINGHLSFYGNLFNESVLDELRQCALLAVLLEIRKFDHVLGQEFNNASAVRVRGAIIDEIRGRDFLKRNDRKKLSTLKKAEKHLNSQLLRTPTDIELSQYMDITLEQLRAYQRIDVTFEDVGMYESILALDGGDEQVEKAYLISRVKESLESLPDNVKKVMYLMFVVGLSVPEISATLSTTDTIVKRIKRQGIQMLKNNLKVD